VASEGERRRGRPVGSGTIKAPTLVSFQLAAHEKLLLSNIAHYKGMTLSELLRQICRAEIDQRTKEIAKADRGELSDLEDEQIEQDM